MEHCTIKAEYRPRSDSNDLDVYIESRTHGRIHIVVDKDSDCLTIGKAEEKPKRGRPRKVQTPDEGNRGSQDTVGQPA